MVYIKGIMKKFVFLNKRMNKLNFTQGKLGVFLNPECKPVDSTKKISSSEKFKSRTH